jgi:hypothetical protein
MTYQQAAHQILQREKNPMSLRIVAQIAFKEGLVRSRKEGITNHKKVNSFIETVRKNIRDIIHNEPELEHPDNDFNLIAIQEKLEKAEIPEEHVSVKEDTSSITYMETHGKKEDELYKAIGKVSNYYSGLESYISSLIWVLIGAGQGVGEIITSELSFPRLITLLRCLFRYRKSDPMEIEKLNSILTRATDIELRRNRVIHSMWAVSTQSNDLLRVKTTARSKTGLKYHFDRTNFDELKKLTDDIVYTISDLSKILIAELADRKKDK